MFGLRGFHNLLSFHLGLDHGHQVFAVTVFVFFRLKRGHQGFDEHLRHRQLFFFHDAGVCAELFHLADLVGIVHCVQQDALRPWPQNHNVFAIVHGDLGHAYATALAQGFKQQRVRLLARLVRR